MASRSLEDLNDYTRGAAIIHKQLCAAKGIQLLVYCTLRPNAEQDALYLIGRSSKGVVVTNARGGQSAHNPNKDGKAAAYDCVGVVGGKAQWHAKSPLWAVIGAMGEEAGLVWSGRWTGKLKETCHFQDPSWRKSV